MTAEERENRVARGVRAGLLAVPDTVSVAGFAKFIEVAVRKALPEADEETSLTEVDRAAEKERRIPPFLGKVRCPKPDAERGLMVWAQGDLFDVADRRFAVRGKKGTWRAHAIGQGVFEPDVFTIVLRKERQEEN